MLMMWDCDCGALVNSRDAELRIEGIRGSVVALLAVERRDEAFATPLTRDDLAEDFFLCPECPRIHYRHGDQWILFEPHPHYLDRSGATRIMTPEIPPSN